MSATDYPDKKKYHDRHNDERRIVYWLKHHLNKLANVIKKVGK